MRLFGKSDRKAHTDAVIRQVAAWLLHYPDEELWPRLGLLESSVSELGSVEPAVALWQTLHHLGSTPARSAEQHYVEVFDTRPRRGLYLTWYVHGDTRLRGGALADLMGLYREHGFRVGRGELPDYLPALLEFTATGDARATREGERLLARFRPAIQLLLRKLTEIDTPYTGAVRAVLATVPHSADSVAVGHQPVEQVGLTPSLRRPVQEGS